MLVDFEEGVWSDQGEVGNDGEAQGRAGGGRRQVDGHAQASRAGEGRGAGDASDDANACAPADEPFDSAAGNGARRGKRDELRDAVTLSLEMAVQDVKFFMGNSVRGVIAGVHEGNDNIVYR